MKDSSETDLFLVLVESDFLSRNVRALFVQNILNMKEILLKGCYGLSITYLAGFVWGVQVY